MQWNVCRQVPLLALEYYVTAMVPVDIETDFTQDLDKFLRRERWKMIHQAKETLRGISIFDPFFMRELFSTGKGFPSSFNDNR